MSENRLTKLEEDLTHQIALTEELNGVVTNQATRIDIMERRIELLLKRAAESEAANLAGGPLPDQKPPHW